MKVDPNRPCLCGSGKFYQSCCPWIIKPDEGVMGMVGDFIKNKNASGRPQDLIDIKNIRKLKQGSK